MTTLANLKAPGRNYRQGITLTGIVDVFSTEERTIAEEEEKTILCYQIIGKG